MSAVVRLGPLFGRRLKKNKKNIYYEKFTEWCNGKLSDVLKVYCSAQESIN
jgi:hypothetical protein